MIPAIVRSVGGWFGVFDPNALATADAIVLAGLILIAANTVLGALLGLLGAALTSGSR